MVEHATRTPEFGSLPRALHFAEQARAGRLAALDALAAMESEIRGHLAQQSRTLAVRDAVVIGVAEGKAPRDARPTSARAAAAITVRSGTQRARVLAYIVEHGGATDHELARKLSMLDSSVRPRRGELVTAGLVADSGRVRLHQGSVWVIWHPTPDGVAWYRSALGGDVR